MTRSTDIALKSNRRWLGTLIVPRPYQPEVHRVAIHFQPIRSGVCSLLEVMECIEGLIPWCYGMANFHVLPTLTCCFRFPRREKLWQAGLRGSFPLACRISLQRLGRAPFGLAWPTSRTRRSIAQRLPRRAGHWQNRCSHRPLRSQIRGHGHRHRCPTSSPC